MNVRDITRSQQPFRRKCLILAGDYRQMLPVIPRSSRAHITAASMKKIPLFRYFTVFELTENTRIGQYISPQHFDRWLPDLISPGLFAVKTLPQSTIWMTLGQEEKTSYHNPSLEAQLTISERYSHCNRIQQAGSLHHLYLQF